MQIVKDKKILLLRFNNYRKHNYIDEHRKVAEENGHVWLVKLGKNIPERSLESVMGESSGLILKAPKADGGKYYYAVISEYFNGNIRQGMKYPDYYNEMTKDINFWLADTLEGTWIKVSNITELDDSVVDDLVLASSGKSVREVTASTMSSLLYVKSRNTHELLG